MKLCYLLLFFFFLPSLIDSDVVEEAGDDGEQPVDYLPNFTGFDCDFSPDEDCLWDWEKDNFTETKASTGLFGSSRPRFTSFPGQYGFYRLDGKLVEKYFNLSRERRGGFFGPKQDRFNSEKGRRKKTILY